VVAFLTTYLYRPVLIIPPMLSLYRVNSGKYPVATYRGGAELWQSSDSDPITTATPSTPATYDIKW
jgi:hypothetical protein